MTKYARALAHPPPETQIKSKASHVLMCQEMLSHDNGINQTFILLIDYQNG